MKKIIAITTAFLLITAAGFAQDWTWDKAHSQLNFGVTHMGINEIDGTFSTADAKMTASKDDLTVSPDDDFLTIALKQDRQKKEKRDARNLD